MQEGARDARSPLLILAGFAVAVFVAFQTNAAEFKRHCAVEHDGAKLAEYTQICTRPTEPETLRMACRILYQEVPASSTAAKSSATAPAVIRSSCCQVAMY